MVNLYFFLFGLLMSPVLSAATTGQKDDHFNAPYLLEHAPDDLQYAFIVIRHGIRSPVSKKFYASDAEYKEKWPEGRGSLTEAGKRLMVHVGQSLRSRYQTVLSDYDETKVEVTSTTSRRATMSALAVAAGMFPPQETIVDDIPGWQPIPVWHTASYDKFHMFGEVEGDCMCPRYIRLRDSLQQSEESLATRGRNRFYRRLSKNLRSSQSNIKTVNSMDDIFVIYDTLLMEKLNLKPYQRWADALMPTMDRWSRFRLWRYMHGKTSMIQFFTGPLFDRLLKELVGQSVNCLLKYVQEQEMCATRLHLHGTHDITLNALFWTLTKKEDFNALPGDCLIFELYRHEKVKLFLFSPMRDKKRERFREISLKSLCGQDPCRLTQLADSIRDLTLTEDQWSRKCQDLENLQLETFRNRAPP